MPEAKKLRLLVVDDTEEARVFLCSLLEMNGYICAQAASGGEARKLLQQQPFELALCDVNMPLESGLSLVSHILAKHPDTATIMVTAMDDQRIANLALEQGAYGYVIKPFEPNEILINVANALRRRKLEHENRANREKLEQAVLARTAELQETIVRLERTERVLRQTQEDVIQRLVMAEELREKGTPWHIQRMSRYCALIAARLEWANERCELIRLASTMHDIGKIGTPDEILFKAGGFTPEESRIMQQHTEIGRRLLSGSAELLTVASTIAWTHHERFDGSGYPRGLVGEAIPQEGRIAAIADAFDAITTRRLYKQALPVEQAVDVMRLSRARQFDPQLLDLFLDSMDQMLAIRRQYPDVERTPAS
ncbi:MAG TPA: HD domain-containing phosphohydrolase [Nitrospiraceae bacterium]|nr:HD domain-containing phosphohydrolase [Nitrospiraceae bacterium]